MLSILENPTIIYSVATTVAIIALALTIKIKVRKAKGHKQADGIQYINQLKQLLSNLQKHRGTSYRVLWGEHSLESTLHIMNSNIQSNVLALDSLKDISNLSERWMAFKDHWDRLRKKNLSLEPENSLEQHNKLITTLIFLMEDVAEQHYLSQAQLHLDIHYETDMNWKNILIAAEWAGQARALGSGMLTSGHHGSVERIRMSFLHSKLKFLAAEEVAGFQASQHLISLTDTIQSELLNKIKPDVTAKVYFDKATTAIDACMKEFDSEIQQIERALH